jgi:23S rRNA (uracil1939-C5)-methyltransferase
MKTDVFELIADTPVYGGDTLARLPDGRAVFIPFCLAGEKVKIKLIEEKKRYARAELLQVINPSPHRIVPRCSHFAECGGCHYQHIPYQEQLKIKQNILIDQLQRVGKIKDPPVNSTVPAPQEWNYRNRIQFNLSKNGKPGFLKHRSNVIVEINECHLPEEVLNQVWPLLDLEFIPGLDRINLRSGERGKDVLLVFESSDPQPIDFELDLPLSAVHQGPGGEIVLAGDEFTVIQVHDFPFVVSSSSFFQVNTRGAELLVDLLLEKLPLRDDMLVLDVYCGVGLFSVFLAPVVSKLVGIESHPSAGDDFLYNLAGFENVEFFDLSAEEVLPNLKSNPDIILLDPPRAGLSAMVLDGVVSLTPDIVAYISCDPATLARDAARLNRGGYQLIDSTPVDMFPQTYHIESINIFQRASQ